MEHHIRVIASITTNTARTWQDTTPEAKAHISSLDGKVIAYIDVAGLHIQGDPSELRKLASLLADASEKGEALEVEIRDAAKGSA